MRNEVFYLQTKTLNKIAHAGNLMNLNPETSPIKNKMMCENRIIGMP